MMMYGWKNELKLKLKRIFCIFKSKPIVPRNTTKQQPTPFYIPKNEDYTDPYTPIKRK